MERLLDRVVGDAATTLWLLFGTVGLVLLIAGANVANLFLVRAESRRRETAVRAALGASGGRIARGFLAESVLLSVLAGGAGVALAVLGVNLLVAYGPVELPRLHEISTDATVLGFAAALSLVSGLALGVLPLHRLVRQSAGAMLHGGSRGSTAGRERQRARQVLIVGQMALALVLLVGAGLMLRSVVRLHAIDPGFRAEGVFTTAVSLGEAPGHAAAVSFYHRLLEVVGGLPGVVSAGVTNALPIQPASLNGGEFEIESRPRAGDELPSVTRWHTVTDGYFETLGIPLLEGRAPSRADAEGGPAVAWVNATFARRFLEDGAVGERLRLPGDSVWREIVGVVGDVPIFSLADEIQPMVSLPLSAPQSGPLSILQLAVKTDGAQTNLPAAIRAALDRVDPTVPLTAHRGMRDIVFSSLARTSFTMVLFAIAAAVALVLGVVGLYGVISYIVSMRTAEIGVRIALGAQPGAVRAMVPRQGLGLTFTGLLVGLVAAAALTRLMDSLLFEVSARDPATFAAVALVLTATSLLATYLPARRATKVDPMAALRVE